MLEHILDLFPCLFKLEWAEFIDWPVNGWSIVLQFNLELMNPFVPVVVLVGDQWERCPCSLVG